MNKWGKIYESYPWTTPFLENLVWLEVYSLGSLIFSIIGMWASAAYFAYCLFIMYVLIPGFVCTHCSYYGRRCHSAQGKLAALLFSRRDASLFASCFRRMRLAAPVFVAPLIAGLILCAVRFSWELVWLTIGFAVLALGCTRMVTKKLGCSHCGQRPVCPAWSKSKI